MTERATDLEDFIKKVRAGELNGASLAKMVESGTLSKTERRLIQRKAAKPEPTARQLLRQEIKAKKAQPRGKLSKEARNAKFSSVDEKERERLKEEANFTICLGCRKRGHFLKDCPKVVVAVIPGAASSSSSSGPAPAVDGICFNCGQSDHILKDCKRPRDRNGRLPFASCFICRRTGHIARDCDQNPNGLYPQGGCCHICLQKTHLVKDCPQRTEEMKEEWLRRRAEQQQDEEDRQLGPRVKGLVDGESSKDVGGDDLGEFGGGSDDDEGAGDKPKKSKAKKDKGERREKKAAKADKKEKRKDRGDEGGERKKKRREE